MKIFTKIKGVLLLSCLCLAAPSFAQDEIGDLLIGSKGDATALTKAYLDPFFKGVGLGLNSGWTNNGSVKKLGRFEIRVGATGAIVPKSDQSFDVSKIGLSNNIRYNGTPVSSQNNIMSPTIAGDEIDGPELALYSGNNEVSTFRLPQGLNPPQSMIPAPQLQASVGLIKGFEATIRFVPEISPSDDFGTFSMIGGGLKFQPLRFLSKKGNALLPFDLAMLVGYSQFKYKYDLNVKQEAGAQPKDGQQSTDFSNQKVEAKFSGINVEAILSKKLLIFTPFVSVGYVTSTTDAGLKGNYPVTTGATLLGNPTYETFTDPVSINEKYIKNMRASAGFQLNLTVLRIYGSYNVAAYNYFNAGVGIGIGK